MLRSPSARLSTSKSEEERFFLASLEQEEDKLLRECFYALRGISGERIQFQSSSSEECWKDSVRIHAPDRSVPPHLRPHSRLGSGAEEALSLCAEAGWLFQRIQAYTNTSGSIQRAFGSALQLELQSYGQFLALLEPKIINLRQLLVDMRAPLHRLQQLALLTSTVQDMPGPQLLHALHRSTRHGDSRHRRIVQDLLAQASAPWFDLLYVWTTEGILAAEFFVAEITSQGTTDDRYLWTLQYKLDYNKVPVGILEQDLIEPAFVVGKGINFIRRCLLDGEWHLQLATSDNTDKKETTKEQLGFVYGKPSQIRQTLYRAAKLVNSHILTTLHQQHSLMQHLFALKQFLLLGQGDFFASLMNGLHGEFEGKVGSIYRYTLAAIVDTALRNTNATGFPDDILARLQPELLLNAQEKDTQYQFGPPKRGKHSKSSSNRTVWDMFVLEYQVPDPLLVIVHPQAVKMYKQIFLFLFGLRRVEFLLNLTWRQSAVLQHALQTSAQHNGLTVTTSPEYAQSIVLLRNVSMTRQAMMHFVVNLKSYLMFEVLEGGWKQLKVTIEEAETLDESIASHDSYLEGIRRKSFVDQDELGAHVQRLLQLVNEFCTYQERVFGAATEAAERAAEKRREAEKRLKKGQWGFEEELTEEGTFFGLANTNKIVDLDRILGTFRLEVLSLLQALDTKLNGGVVVPETVPSSPGMHTPSAEPRDDSSASTKPGEHMANTQDDLNSLRFFAFQLDCNKFYSK